jgi:hypothetical protein
MQDYVYSVSLVFIKNQGHQIDSALRTILLYAASKDEAFGTAYRILSKDFIDAENWTLSMHAIMEVSSFMEGDLAHETAHN